VGSKGKETASPKKERGNVRFGGEKGPDVDGPERGNAPAKQNHPAVNTQKREREGKHSAGRLVKEESEYLVESVWGKKPAPGCVEKENLPKEKMLSKKRRGKGKRLAAIDQRGINTPPLCS